MTSHDPRVPAWRQPFTLRNGARARIDPVQDSDAHALLEYLEVLAAESDYLTFGPSELALTLEQQRAYIATFAEGAGGLMVKATQDGALIGFASIRRTQRPRIAHVAEFGIAVSRALWSCGVGDRLCQTVIAQAPGLGIARIELRVREDNLRAQRLYQRHGFLLEGRAVGSFQVGHRRYDELLMARVWPADRHRISRVSHQQRRPHL